MVTAVLKFFAFMVFVFFHFADVFTSYYSIVCSSFFQLQLMGKLRPDSMIILVQGLTMMHLGDGALLCFTVPMAVG